MTWRKFSGEVVHSSLVEEIEKAIIQETEKGYRLKVCIGTDSQVKGAITDFATVIVLVQGASWRLYVHPPGKDQSTDEH